MVVAMDEMDLKMVRVIRAIHRRGCRIFAYRVAMYANTTEPKVSAWFHQRGLWFSRQGCGRRDGAWLIECPEAFEPVRSELEGIFEEAEITW